MSEAWTNFWAAVVVVLLVLVFGVFFAWGANYKCEHRWRLSGMNARWELFSGCLVQRKDGTWIPSANLRNITP